VEEARFARVLQDGDVEIRDYAPQIVAETRVSGSMKDAGNTAFRPLFRYIDGDNEAQAEIAMTAPVAQREGEKIAMTAPVAQRAEQDEWVVSFMMPAQYTMDTIPRPTDSRVSLRQIPAHRMAVIRYSGRWTERNYQEQLQRLRAWMDENGLEATGEPVWARYNAPFSLPFMRRNEILMPLAEGALPDPD
jgi:effector-binding domain-containing protein